MFNRSPVGKYHILVCGTTPCMLCGARTLSAAIKEHLSIDYGQTTPVSQGSAALHQRSPCAKLAMSASLIRQKAYLAGKTCTPARASCKLPSRSITQVTMTSGCTIPRLTINQQCLQHCHDII